MDCLLPAALSEFTKLDGCQAHAASETRASSSYVFQVVEKLIRGLAMEDSRNMFALFEYNGHVDKAIESRTIVADVLAKFEK